MASEAVDRPEGLEYLSRLDSRRKKPL